MPKLYLNKDHIINSLKSKIINCCAFEFSQYPQIFSCKLQGCFGISIGDDDFFFLHIDEVLNISQLALSDTTRENILTKNDYFDKKETSYHKFNNGNVKKHSFSKKKYLQSYPESTDQNQPIQNLNDQYDSNINISEYNEPNAHFDCQENDQYEDDNKANVNSYRLPNIEEFTENKQTNQFKRKVKHKPNGSTNVSKKPSIQSLKLNSTFRNSNVSVNVPLLTMNTTKPHNPYVVTRSFHECGYEGCGKQFKWKQHLLRHQTSKHGRMPTKSVGIDVKKNFLSLGTEDYLNNLSINFTEQEGMQYGFSNDTEFNSSLADNNIQDEEGNKIESNNFYFDTGLFKGKGGKKLKIDNDEWNDVANIKSEIMDENEEGVDADNYYNDENATEEDYPKNCDKEENQVWVVD